MTTQISFYWDIKYDRELAKPKHKHKMTNHTVKSLFLALTDDTVARCNWGESGKVQLGGEWQGATGGRVARCNWGERVCMYNAISSSRTYHLCCIHAAKQGLTGVGEGIGTVWWGQGYHKYYFRCSGGLTL